MARKLTIVIGGDSKGAEKAIHDAEKAAGGMGDKLGKFGKIVAGSFLVGGGAIVGFATKSASTFAKIGGEVAKLSRYTGATAKDASRLRFAAKQAGVDTDVLTKSLGLLSKNIVGGKVDKLGFQFKDIHGKALPLNDSLLKIAGRFEKMPNGAEKTALAMKLFGKSGAAMLPFLNKGAKGIAELERQSDKYGNTLTEKDLVAVKESTKQHRLFSSAMDGLQIQVGRYVLPILTKLTTFFASKMPRAIGVARGVMKGIVSVIAPIAAQIKAFFYSLTSGFTEDEGTPVERVALKIRAVLLKVADIIQTRVIPAVQGIFKFLMKHKEILVGVAVAIGVGLVSAFVSWAVAAASAAAATIAAAAPVIAIGVAIAALVAGLIYAYKHWGFFKAAVDAVAHFFTHDLLPAIGAVFGWVKNNWPTLLAILAGPIGVAVLLIIKHWDKISTLFSTFWQWFQAGWDKILGFLSGVWDGIKGGAGAAWDWVKSKISGVFDWITGLPGRIGDAFAKVGDFIAKPFLWAFDTIAKLWNATVGKLRFEIPSWVPGIGGNGFDVPDLPRITGLAKGGIVTRPTLALVGESGPEAVIPLGRGGGTGTTIHLNVSVAPGGEAAAAKAIVHALESFARAGGSFGPATRKAFA